jgi:hypothetical protein
MNPMIHAQATAVVGLESPEPACYTHASTNFIHTICPGRRS